MTLRFTWIPKVFRFLSIMAALFVCGALLSSREVYASHRPTTTEPPPAPATYYVSPTGTGDDRTAATPRNPQLMLNSARGGDEIIFLDGVYPAFPRCDGLRLILRADSAIRIRDIATVGQ